MRENFFYIRRKNGKFSQAGKIVQLLLSSLLPATYTSEPTNWKIYNNRLKAVERWK